MCLIEVEKRQKRAWQKVFKTIANLVISRLLGDKYPVGFDNLFLLRRGPGESLPDFSP